MKKNGFTLVELIAVIAILGIMGLLVSPAILKIRENSLRNSLDGKISMIKSAAIEYASDHLNDLHKYPVTSEQQTCNSVCIKSFGNPNIYEEISKEPIPSSCIENGKFKYNCANDFCKVINVSKDLITQGYLAGDSADKESLINPLNNNLLDEFNVCITFDKYTADRKIVTYVMDQNLLYE